MQVDRRSLLIGGAVAGSLAAPSRAARHKPSVLASTPPMGWNSWNSFATTITEQQVRETAAILSAKLLPFGYDILTVDIQWYEPGASSYAYAGNPTPTLDGHGRLLPAPNRFPSSRGGRGFAPLAAYVHSLGLKFGVHLMRGIPRLAVKRNLPILSVGHSAVDIADTDSVCSWNPDMFGVDMLRPGAQAYYDSVFALLASWGVDFVKMDDMSRPYDAHAPEIEAAHLAIHSSGRPIILSLSPGETPLSRANHVRRHAQMWRISDDFWDEWPQLEAQFTRLENWNSFRRPGCWPDADMLPLGRLALGARQTKFTPDEQQTLMTLWSIARSPLIMGGDLRALDDATLALLTNREVLAVNQASADNQPLFIRDGIRVWIARPTDRPGRYVAVFNTTDAVQHVTIGLRDIDALGRSTARDLWKQLSAPLATDGLRLSLPPHAATLHRLF